MQTHTEQTGMLTILRRILAQAWRYRWWIAVSVATSAITASLFAWLLVVMDRLFRSWSAVQAAFDGGGDTAVASPAAIADMRQLGWQLFAIAPLMAASAYASVVAGQRLANLCMRDLRQRFLVHLVELDLGFHTQASRGDLMTRMMSDITVLYRLQSALYGKLLQRPLEILAILATIMYINWILGLCLMVALVPVVFSLIRVLGRTRRRSQRARADLSKNLTIFEQIVSGIRVIKTMGSADREAERFAGTNEALFRSNMKVARARGQSDAVSMGFIFLVIGLALFLGAWLFEWGWVEPAALLVLFMGLGRLAGAIREFQRGVGDLMAGLPSAERVFEVLDREPRLSDAPDAIVCPVPREAIRLQQVRFHYDAGQAPVLRNIDLDIPIGATVALVGASGGGKSTLLDLIPRLYDVQGGAVTWDGVDVRRFTRASLVHHCAIVQQQSFLFDGTVMDNIRYGRPDASDEAVFAVARRANIHADILALEGGLGYQTRVGDDGSRLSGGQRQRIAIARAMLRDAPVLLMDEPTSALDAESERLVQAALAELMAGRTTVIVAHRLATVQHADRIYVLAGKQHERPGTLIEAGTHAQLLAAGGAYASMVAAQTLVSE